MGKICTAVVEDRDNRNQRSDSRRRAATIVLVVNAKGPVLADSFIGELFWNLG
jgi:hypothetical protein